jgi:protein SMG5
MDNLTWSPYLIVDTMALCENLKLVQDLTRTNKFIIIVHLVVIDNLYSIKKDSKLAREAIRWLENQFKQGNRFLRAQTQNEKINYGHDMTLRKRDLELWRFHQLIDCCKYFQEESTIHSNNSHSHENRANIITILTFSELNDEKFKNMVKLSAENSIKLENIKEFCDRWKLAYSK